MSIAITSIVLGAATSGTSFAAQSAQAKAQKSQQEQLGELEKQRYLTEASQVRQKQALEAEASALEQSKIQKEGRRQQATARTAAGEAGVTGLSADTLLNEYAAQEASLRSQANRQQQLNERYTEQSLEASRLGSQFNMARINEPISRPSALTLALGIGSAGLDSARTYKEFGGKFGK